MGAEGSPGDISRSGNNIGVIQANLYLPFVPLYVYYICIHQEPGEKENN